MFYASQRVVYWYTTLQVQMYKTQSMLLSAAAVDRPLRATIVRMNAITNNALLYNIYVCIQVRRRSSVKTSKKPITIERANVRTRAGHRGDGRQQKATQAHEVNVFLIFFQMTTGESFLKCKYVYNNIGYYVIMYTAANGTLLLWPIIIPYTRYLTYWVARALHARRYAAPSEQDDRKIIILKSIDTIEKQKSQYYKTTKYLYLYRNHQCQDVNAVTNKIMRLIPLIVNIIL